MPRDRCLWVPSIVLLKQGIWTCRRLQSDPLGRQQHNGLARETISDVSSFLLQESSKRTRLCAWLHTSILSHGAMLQPPGLWTTQHDTRLLTPCWPPGLWNAAHALSMAMRDVLAVKISAEGSHGVCVGSLPIWILSYTPLALQWGWDLQSPAGSELGGIQNTAPPLACTTTAGI
jgi:hypothetical protein